MVRIRIAIGLLSAAVIAYQIALIQILSIAHWHHFAYMVLSVAMLGFGASGTVLALFRSVFLRHSGLMIPMLSLLTAVAMSSAVFLVEKGVGGFDTYLLFIDHSEIVKLMMAYLLYTMPFFCGALAIGLILTRYARDIGRIYFYNMAGSGAGGLLGITAMWFFFPGQLASLISLLPFAAALVSSTNPQRRRKSLALIAALALLIMAAGFTVPPQISMSQYKSLSGTMNLPGAEILIRDSSPYGVTEAVKTDASRYAPGVSLSYTGEIPVEPMVFVNGNWSGPVQDPAGVTVNLFRQTTKQLAYLVREPGRVLITSAGTGRHIIHALANDATGITAVESNTVLTRVTDRVSLDFYSASILQHEAVVTVQQSNRAYMSRSQGGYSHIILPTLDAFGGTSGLYALQEQYDLTLDAFSQMWDLLLPDGVIAVTSWIDQPPRNTLRILATLAETAEANGIEVPAGHIAAIRSWSTITFVLCKAPLGDEAVGQVREFSYSQQFDPALLPDITGAERLQFNHTDPAFFDYMDTILTGDRTGFHEEYIFNTEPVTDNRPFFSQFLKTGNLGELDTIYGRQSVPFIELGYLVLLLTGAQILVAGFVFIILPLFRIGWRGSKKGWTLFYFGGIGTGFMFVEVNLIQQFIHFFGQPVYATAVVLSVLLISSGTGSYFSHHLSAFRRGVEKLLMALAVLILIFQAMLPVIIDAGIAATMPVRLIISVLIIAPVGFLMGMPFPSGIRLLAQRDSVQIPWAWGINGCFSVFSTVLAVWLALERGYNTVLITGATAYLTAAIATWYINRNR